LLILWISHIHIFYYVNLPSEPVEKVFF
jgi:hypothetical protein